MNMKKVYEVVKIKEVAEEEKFIIRCPQDGANVAAEFIGDEDREVFFILCMDTKNNVVAVHRCHVVGLNASLVVPREVFKSAILNNSASIILSHQDPSHDVTPSREDIEVMHRLVECGRLLGIEVLDHLIVNAKADFYSMKERGHL